MALALDTNGLADRQRAVVEDQGAANNEKRPA